jgi:hypothetical protein
MHQVSISCGQHAEFLMLKPAIKSNLFLCSIQEAPRHEDVRGGGGIAPPFLTSTLDRSGQLHVPTALPRGQSAWYPLDRRLGGPPSQFESCGEHKKSVVLVGN